ncbi:substrate-binding domain-containing protein [Nitratireductor sp. GCM10026969]|uniref:substrate-binding domain-containing protein n=1 Tax=Nitratireductor sp. GCM10026969 TaxID=3252645 RepID=UPI003607D7B5
MNLRRLSELLGLSQTTVSRALNGFPEVNEVTRARVIAAAQRLNYRPSASAASLATGKACAIGHVVPLTEHMMINPHFSDFLAGAGEIYAQFGYEMLLRVVAQVDEADVYRDFASRGRVDGVVLHGPLTNDPRLPLLKSLGLPFVVHGRCDEEAKDYSWIDVNNRRAFYRATGFLADLGHRRIALINGLETMNFADRRRQGYEAVVAERGLEADPALVFSEDMVEPYGYRAAVELLSGPQPPTAILVSSVLPAMGVVRAMAEHGLRPGRDVSVIAFDDSLSFLQASGEGKTGEVPFFTAMRSSIRQAGRRAAEMLLEQIGAPDGAPRRELWEAELVIGQTTGPCPADRRTPVPADEGRG